jgi:hypothetical protein
MRKTAGPFAAILAIAFAAAPAVGQDQGTGTPQDVERQDAPVIIDRTLGPERDREGEIIRGGGDSFVQIQGAWATDQAACATVENGTGLYLTDTLIRWEDATCSIRNVDTANGSATVHALVVDLHAEATSEKMALGHLADGRASAVIGTHTHVPTADAWIMPGGTAYITDVGMTGARGGVIGVRREQSIAVMRSHMPQRYDAADEDPWLNAVLIRATGRRADAIEQILRSLDPPVTGG